MKKTTLTWMIFERYVLETGHSVPHAIGPLSKGQAISLKVGIGRAINEYIKERGLQPADFPYSAREVTLTQFNAMDPMQVASLPGYGPQDHNAEAHFLLIVRSNAKLGIKNARLSPAARRLQEQLLADRQLRELGQALPPRAGLGQPASGMTATHPPGDFTTSPTKVTNDGAGQSPPQDAQDQQESAITNWLKEA